MDEVFGNSSGETVIESPPNQSVATEYVPCKLQDSIHEENVIKGEAAINLQYKLKDSFDIESPVLPNHQKSIDLNATQAIQLEQNSENHQLEKIQLLTSTKFAINQVNYVEQLQDDSKLNDNKNLSNSIEEYLNKVNKKSPVNVLSNISNSTETIKENNSNAAKDEIPSKLIRNDPRHLPYLNSSVYQLPPMRHVQSEDTVQVHSPNTRHFQQARPRAHTTASLAVRHLYQNLPVPLIARQSPHRQQFDASLSSPKAQMFPTYVNVPAPRTHKLKKVDTNKPNRPYSKIWSDNQMESLSDTECDGVRKHQALKIKKSLKSASRSSCSPGYVQMTSPFVRSPVSSVFAQLATSLANYAGHAPQTIFCPLCPRQFSYERLLSSHIHRSHRLELEDMVEGKPGDLCLQCCPVCQARFFNSSVLPKHLIDCHKDCVLQLLEKHNCIKVTSKGMQCPFCVKCVPLGISGEHVLIFHLQQYHLAQYEDMIARTFEAYSSAVRNGIHSNQKQANFSEIFGFDPGAASTPGLSKKMGSLLVNSDSKRKLDDVEKEDLLPLRNTAQANCVGKTPTNFDKNKARRSVSKGILRRENECRNKPNVKRELRFSVPHVTKEEIYFPESPGPITPDYQERVDLNVFSYPERGPEAQNEALSEIESVPCDEFIDMNQQLSRKRRKLGISIKSGKIFRCKDKENQEEKYEKVSQPVYVAANVRTFRKPKPVPTPTVPQVKLPPANGSPCAAKLHSTTTANILQASVPNKVSNSSLTDVPDFTSHAIDSEDAQPFSSLKLHSPLRLFRCCSCRSKFCDSDSLTLHLSQHHRGLLSLLRPQFGCGVCAAKFYESKYLIKHCLQHHTSLLEFRGPVENEAEDCYPSALKHHSRLQQITAL